MKKLKMHLRNFNLWAITFLLITATSSCRDDSLDITNSLSKKGGFVRFESQNPPSTVGVNQISDLNYSFTVIDANKNVETYDLKIYANLGGTVTDTMNIETVTTFPTTFNFDANDLASHLGIEVSEINFGDSVFFVGTTTTEDGTVYTAEELDYDDLDDENLETFSISGGGMSPDLLSEEGYKQALAFSFIILCPDAEIAELTGTYDVTNHRFDAFFPSQGTTREVIAGPGENQITIIGGALPVDGADDLVLDINLVTSEVSYGGEAGKIHFNTFGPGTYGAVSGLVFSCVGVIDITIESDGFIPNFLTLNKQ